MANQVLVVEDSSTQARRTQMVLEGAGYEVELAGNGKVGLEKALAGHPDLVVTDLQMPEMDGYELTRRLKSNPGAAAIPILMLTSHDQPLDVVKGLDAGADHFVTKPYQEDDLVERVRSLFTASRGIRGAEQQLRRFGQEIVITKSREQMLQALYQATERAVGCEAMALLLDRGRSRHLLFVMSCVALKPATQREVASEMARALGRLRSDFDPKAAMEVVPLVGGVAGRGMIRESELCRSTLQAALMVRGRVAGMIGAFSPRARAFDPGQVKFLFDIGTKAAEALSRLCAGD